MVPCILPYFVLKFATLQIDLLRPSSKHLELSRASAVQGRKGDPPMVLCTLPDILLPRNSAAQGVRRHKVRGGDPPKNAKNGTAPRAQSIKSSLAIGRREGWEEGPQSPKELCFLISSAYLPKLTPRVNFQGNDRKLVHLS
jgi:hypothetical protein